MSRGTTWRIHQKTSPRSFFFSLRSNKNSKLVSAGVCEQFSSHAFRGARHWANKITMSSLYFHCLNILNAPDFDPGFKVNTWIIKVLSRDLPKIKYTSLSGLKHAGGLPIHLLYQRKINFFKAPSRAWVVVSVGKNFHFIIESPRVYALLPRDKNNLRTLISWLRVAAELR